MKCVDCQSHVFPPAYAELLMENSGFLQTEKTGRKYVVSFGPNFQMTLDPAAFEPTLKLRDMDNAAVDLGILSVNMPGPELLEPQLAARGARICNDYVAQLCGQYPDRFAGLGVLPLQNVAAAQTEMHRAINELGLKGIMLFSHAGGRSLDNPDFEPIYAAAEAQAVPLVLHPTCPAWAQAISDHAIIPMLGFMVDTSIAMLRIILSGILERYPKLSIVHPHCGGVLPYLMARVEEQTQVKKRGRHHITQSPATYYANVYLDLASTSARTIEFACRSSQPDKLLFASDHPWIQIDAGQEALEQAEIDPQHKIKILRTNACRLFKL